MSKLKQVTLKRNCIQILVRWCDTKGPMILFNNETDVINIFSLNPLISGG